MAYSIHSFSDYTGRSLAAQPASEFSGLTVRGLCISQETPDTVALPSGVTDCTLEGCQLDNCLIPAGYTVVRGSNKRYRKQNCQRDWEIDADGNPIRLMQEAYWTKLGISTDPADIPAEPIAKQDGVPIEETIKSAVNKVIK